MMGQAGAGAAVPQRRSEVREAIDMVHQHITAAEGFSNKLLERLSDVLRQEPTPTPENAKTESPHRVTLAMEIRNLGEKMITINSVLESILNRIEV